MKEIHPLALFRLSVSGPLVRREALAHGELKNTLRELASKPHHIPNSTRCYLSEKTIEAWYYAYHRDGIDALAPRVRCDAGQSKLLPEVQAALLQAKRDKPKRSINPLRQLLEKKDPVAKGQLSRSAIHRLLKQHGLSRPTGCASELIERRPFVAEFANDLGQGDVMHGPKVRIGGRLRKTCLVSLMDDASRLITHSAFYLAEGALEIEAVLKQAVLKYGLPSKLIIDNGPAYRAKSLQGICARLKIQLVYCRPYQPQGKGKLERWHRTVRNHFLDELNLQRLQDLSALNSRLWAWLAQSYHVSAHDGLKGITPKTRYQQDLAHIRPLGTLADKLNALFYHRHTRKVRKDGTLTFHSPVFEVPYELTATRVVLVVDPHTQQPIRCESKTGQDLGPVVPSESVANTQRRRCRATEIQHPPSSPEIVHQQYNQALSIHHKKQAKNHVPTTFWFDTTAL